MHALFEKCVPLFFFGSDGVFGTVLAMFGWWWWWWLWGDSVWGWADLRAAHGTRGLLQRSRECIRCYSYILGLECDAYGCLQ